MPGACTGVAGYTSSAELQFLIARGGLIPQYNQGSNSMTLVYNGNTWFSYMFENTMAFRKLIYQGQGFAGSSEWAIDLSAFSPDNGANNGIPYIGRDSVVVSEWCDCSRRAERKVKHQ